jgi:hypothetical protein
MKYVEFLNIRAIKNLIFISVLSKESRILVKPYTQTNPIINVLDDGWYTQTSLLNDALYEMALGVKRNEFEFSNFLIPDQPEIFEDMPLFKGTHFPSFPTRLKRFPIAVTIFSPYEIDTVNATPDQIKVVEAYNREIAEKNRRLKEIFEKYPYEYEFITEMDDKTAYQKGYQYVLRSFNTSGKNIKKLLNYEFNDKETDYITVVPLEGGGRTLQTTPVEKSVYKFYIKQTIAGDVYVGRHWDADANWENALRYHLMHMIEDFEK